MSLAPDELRRTSDELAANLTRTALSRADAQVQASLDLIESTAHENDRATKEHP